MAIKNLKKIFKDNNLATKVYCLFTKITFIRFDKV